MKIRHVKDRWVLAAGWLVALGFVVFTSMFFSGETSTFYGIAETKEVIVSHENSVEIKRITVVEGQTVKKGDKLVELISPELQIEINLIEHQIGQLRAQKGIGKSEIQSKIGQLRAEKATIERDIAFKISQLENRYKMNRNLAKGIKSIAEISEKDGDVNNPLLMEIENLKKEQTLAVKPKNIEIAMLDQQLRLGENPIAIEIERLEKQLAMINEKSSQLSIVASMPGIIGALNFKAGEKVAPFAPIMTLYSMTPSFIKGYVNEGLCTTIPEGKDVSISSIASPANLITGTVISVGGRIVQIPVRLTHNPAVQMWGREVTIKIPESSGFILGEKVIVRFQQDADATFFTRIKKMFRGLENTGAIK